MALMNTIYLFLDYPSRKPIPIRSDHQVDVLAWSQGIMDSLDYLETSEQVIFSPQDSGLELSVGNIDEKRHTTLV